MACLAPSQDRMTAGALRFLAGVIAFMGIVTAETRYPGYSTSQKRRHAREKLARAEARIRELEGTAPPGQWRCSGNRLPG